MYPGLPPRLDEFIPLGVSRGTLKVGYLSRAVIGKPTLDDQVHTVSALLSARVIYGTDGYACGAFLYVPNSLASVSPLLLKIKPKEYETQQYRPCLLLSQVGVTLFVGPTAVLAVMNNLKSTLVHDDAKS